MRRFFVLFVLLTISAVPSLSQCVAPHYRRVGSLRLSKGAVRISLRPRDFTVSNLICLVQRLKIQHPEWNDVALLIFTSYEDAKNYIQPSIEEIPASKKLLAKRLRAVYFYNQKDNLNRLTLLPFGDETATPYGTVISFPVPHAPHCRLEIYDRCLFASELFFYPDEAVKTTASGTVALEGSLDSEGKIKNVRVLTKEILPKSQEGVLVRDAVENFTSWWLDPSHGPVSIRVEYSYVIDSSLEPGHRDAKIEAPNRLVLRANP